MINLKIKFLKHGLGLDLPRHATAQSAGLDLQAAITEKVIIQPMQRMLIPTGIAIALDKEHEAQIRPRSGLAVKFGITVLNSPGTIDADYRGEIKVCLINLGQNIFNINRGDRIAQMVISTAYKIEFSIVQELTNTERGEGGFGSTE